MSKHRPKGDSGAGGSRIQKDGSERSARPGSQGACGLGRVPEGPMAVTKKTFVIPETVNVAV